MSVASYATAVPRLRCGHTETIDLDAPDGPTVARCWKPVTPGSDLCLHHGVRRAVLRARERMATRAQGSGARG